MSYLKKILTILLCSILISLSISNETTSASTDDFALVILSNYSKVLDIGEEFYLFAVTSNGNTPTFKSSNSKVASVNTYGFVTAKKAGTAKITANIKNAEASCKITVNKTKIIINVTRISMENGESYHLSATTSNHSEITWKSSKKSVAAINESGIITSLKPGETTITASADGSSTTCKLTVKQPKVSLSPSSLKLYRGNTYRLSATVSSKIAPTWKSNKKSVVIVDNTGKVTAIKNGTAIITATVDGVSKLCEITVMKPDITLNQTEITMKKGENATLTANVSSGNKPTWSSSNTNLVTINSKGELTALAKGKAYVYAFEDGTKVRCIVNVTE